MFFFLCYVSTFLIFFESEILLQGFNLLVFVLRYTSSSSLTSSIFIFSKFLSCVSFFFQFLPFCFALFPSSLSYSVYLFYPSLLPSATLFLPPHSTLFPLSPSFPLPPSHFPSLPSVLPRLRSSRRAGRRLCGPPLAALLTR